MSTTPNSGKPESPLARLERLRSRKTCHLCSADAVVTMTWTQGAGGRSLWNESHSCHTHRGEVAARCHAAGNIVGVKNLG